MAGNPSCGANSFCMGAFLIFLGSVLICALGFTIVLPHAATRDWPEVKCHVTNATYDFLHCTCDQQISSEDLGCVNKYPCLEITIRYSVIKSALHNITGLDFQVKTLTYDQIDSTTSLNNQNKVSSYKAAGLSNRGKKHSDGNNEALPHPNVESGTVIHRKEGAVSRSNIKNRTEANSIDKQVMGSVDEVLDPTSSQTEDTPGVLTHRSITGAIGISEPSTAESESNPQISTANSVSDTGFAAVSDQTVQTDNQTEVITVTTTLYRGWSDAFYGKCSLHECGVEEWNIKEAARFNRNWGNLGQSFTCYYQPDAPDIVILHKTPRSAVMHAILWPCLCLASGCLLWLGLCVGCCKMESEYESSEYRSTKI